MPGKTVSESVRSTTLVVVRTFPCKSASTSTIFPPRITIPVFCLRVLLMPSNNQPPRITISSEGGSDHCAYAVENTNSRIRAAVLHNLLIDKFIVSSPLMWFLYFLRYK
ncbi:MAG: hypothetical protein RPS99_10715 [Gammaproteobacteria bacterium]